MYQILPLLPLIFVIYPHILVPYKYVRILLDMIADNDKFSIIKYKIPRKLYINKYDLPSHEYKEFISSVWNINLDLQKLIPRDRSDHKGPTSQEIYYRLILFLSHPNDLIFDYFSGTGTLSCVSKLICRNSINIDVNIEYVILSKRNCLNLPNPYNTGHDFLCSDTRKIHLESKFVDLIVSSPPYYNSIKYSSLKDYISNFTFLD